MNDVETNLIKEVRNSDTNHNHPPLFTLWNVCISYLQASWHKEALKKNQQKHVLLLSVFLSWHSIDNSYISSQNPILHNYNILLKSRRCMVRFLSLPAAPDLGDMQSETSPAKSISVHQGTQHFICHSYCHVNPKSHNVLYYWRGGDKDMPLQTLPFVTNKQKKKEKKKKWNFTISIWMLHLRLSHRWEQWSLSGVVRHCELCFQLNMRSWGFPNHW